MKRYFLLLLILCSTNIFAQNYKNYVTPHYSYAFMGSGDVWGNSVGLNYTAILYSKFGLTAGYNKSTSSYNIFSDVKEFDYKIQSNYKDFDVNYAIYNSYNLGLAYSVGDGSDHRLLASAGLSYKHIKSTELWAALWSTHQETGKKDYVEFDRVFYNKYNEYGIYVNLDYTYFFTDTFGIGTHASIESSEHILSMIGISCSARF